MTSRAQTDSRSTAEVPLAILLEGVSEKWGMNVLQILGRPASAKVEVDGHGTILAPAILPAKRKRATSLRKSSSCSALRTRAPSSCSFGMVLIRL
jgi:hypothetical protein